MLNLQTTIVTWLANNFDLPAIIFHRKNSGAARPAHKEVRPIPPTSESVENDLNIKYLYL